MNDLENLPTVVVGIAKSNANYDVWRLAFNGSVLGDSRGFNQAQAIVEARRKVAECNAYRYPDGIYILDPALAPVAQPTPRSGHYDDCGCIACHSRRLAY